jgi:hypothetical protein
MEELVDISPAEAVQLGATSLTLYGKMFFPKTFRQASPEFHEDISAALLDTHSRQVALEIFRDGAKTTLLRTYMSQRIAYGLARTVLIVSASQGHSILSLRWLKRQVETNRNWAQTFGLTKGSKWTDDICEIYHGVEETPITVMALGISGQIRGYNIDDYRPDLIICDDVSTDETSGSLDQRNKEQGLIFGALINSLAPRSESPTAKVVILDTPKNKFDLIEGLEKAEDWRFYRFGIFDENGESRWPERYPTAELLAAKEAAAKQGKLSIWLREKECKIVQAELAAFNQSNLLFWDKIPEGASYVIAIDPASSEDKNADDNVVMVVAFWGDDVFVVDYRAATGQTPEMVKVAVFEFARKYKPVGVVVEAISYQRVLAWYLERAMRDQRLYLPVHRVEVHSMKKADRIIQALGGVAAYHHLHCLPSHTKLLEQYAEFAPGVKMHDDVLDALAIGVQWGQEHGLGLEEEDDYARTGTNDNVVRFRRGAP